MPLKANNPHVWRIILRGKTASKTFFFTGTVDEALNQADVLECGVRFTVTEFKITRGKRAKSPKPSSR